MVGYTAGLGHHCEPPCGAGHLGWLEAAGCEWQRGYRRKPWTGSAAKGNMKLRRTRLYPTPVFANQAEREP